MKKVLALLFFVSMCSAQQRIVVDFTFTSEEVVALESYLKFWNMNLAQRRQPEIGDITGMIQNQYTNVFLRAATNYNLGLTRSNVLVALDRTSPTNREAILRLLSNDIPRVAEATNRIRVLK